MIFDELINPAMLPDFFYLYFLFTINSSVK